MSQEAQNPLCHLLNKLDIQGFESVSRLVVMRVAEKSRVGDHHCGNTVVPERRMVAQPDLGEICPGAWHHQMLDRNRGGAG